MSLTDKMSKKTKQSRFLHIWINQVELGRKYNLSPIAMGQKLVTLGLKNHDGTPSAKALAKGFCFFKVLHGGTLFYRWNEQKLSELFKANGLLPKK